MEEATISIDEEDPQFLDASDDFPFYDCLDSPNHNQNRNHNRNHNSDLIQGLRRRRSTASKDFEFQPTTSGSDYLQPTSPIQQQQQPVKDTSTLTFDDSPSIQSNNHNDNNNGGAGLLLYIAELLVKAIGYQFNLLISFLTFPFWVIYYTCMLAFNPFFVLGLVKSFLIGKLKKLGDAFRPYVTEWLNDNQSCFNLVMRCGWGLFCSVYVCILLFTLLIFAFVFGGLIMRNYVVQEPFQLKQALNFDYTSSKPVAYVPIVSCPSHDNEVGNAAGFLRVIPPKHKLQTTVTMLLPESEYNQNLGIFQVKVEFISENGKSLGTFRHPCMLEFKSQPLRLLLTFFKIIPLVAGYLSETQLLKLTFRGYTEGLIPTTCLKITMEQRAEFRPGAGIPQVYDAYVYLESELPFLRRILWYWRRTIFVWLSMTVFAVELLFALVCCRHAIIPRTRSGSNVTSSNPPLTTHSARS